MQRHGSNAAKGRHGKGASVFRVPPRLRVSASSVSSVSHRRPQQRQTRQQRHQPKPRRARRFIAPRHRAVGEAAARARSDHASSWSPRAMNGAGTKTLTSTTSSAPAPPRMASQPQANCERHMANRKAWSPFAVCGCYLLLASLPPTHPGRSPPAPPCSACRETPSGTPNAAGCSRAPDSTAAHRVACRTRTAGRERPGRRRPGGVFCRAGMQGCSPPSVCSRLIGLAPSQGRPGSADQHRSRPTARSAVPR